MNIIYEKVSAQDIYVDEREIWARLGGIGALDRGRIDGVIKEIASIATPAFVFCELSVRVNNAKCVYTGEISIVGEGFAKMVNNCPKIIVMCATIGAGVDRLIRKKSSLSVSDGFIFDAVASAMVEGLLNLVTVRTTSGKEHTNRFSPGYGDMPLDIQDEIITLLEATKRMGVALNESKLMSPSKSVTAFIGIN